MDLHKSSIERLRPKITPRFTSTSLIGKFYSRVVLSPISLNSQVSYYLGLQIGLIRHIDKSLNIIGVGKICHETSIEY